MRKGKKRKGRKGRIVWGSDKFVLTWIYKRFVKGEKFSVLPGPGTVVQGSGRVRRHRLSIKLVPCFIERRVVKETSMWERNNSTLFNTNEQPWAETDEYTIRKAVRAARRSSRREKLYSCCSNHNRYLNRVEFLRESKNGSILWRLGKKRINQTAQREWIDRWMLQEKKKGKHSQNVINNLKKGRKRM